MRMRSPACVQLLAGGEAADTPAKASAPSLKSAQAAGAISLKLSTTKNMTLGISR
jgi:hypothetical protein